jgi:exopolyphosphatase / guanosine-5'-triphosphate,3'-diphosphate pyrophosphatase
VAVIDLGSNAVRLQVAEVLGDGGYSVIREEREPCRLGQGVFLTRKLAPAAVDRTLDALSRIHDIVQTYSPNTVRAAATSAVRDAENRDEFLRQVHERFGLEVELLSGEREAELIAKGVLSGELGAADVERVAIVDVGGGSTEVIAAAGRTVDYRVSVDVGSVRLTEMFVHSDPIHADDQRRLQDHLRGRLASLVDLRALGRCRTLVGSAGTMRAFAQYVVQRRTRGAETGEPQSGVVCSYDEVVDAANAIRAMSFADRKSVPGLDDSRSDIIVAGATLVEEIVRFVGATRLVVSRRGLRHGLMVDAISHLRHGRHRRA